MAWAKGFVVGGDAIVGDEGFLLVYAGSESYFG